MMSNMDLVDIKMQSTASNIMLVNKNLSDTYIVAQFDLIIL